MFEDIIEAEEMLTLYQKVIEGKPLEVISREMNIPLDILREWKADDFAALKDEIRKIKESAKDKRRADEKELDAMEDAINRADVDKLF